MSKRNRLVQYITPPPAVSLEQAEWAKAMDKGIGAGIDLLFEGIGKGFTLLTKAMRGAEKSPDPHKLVDEKGNKIYDSQWLRKSTEGITKYWADSKWVTDNLNSRDVQAAKLAIDLSLNGKVFGSPVDALREQEKIVRGIIQKYQPAIHTYTQQLNAIEDQAERMIADQSPEVVAQWMIDEAKKIKSPLPNGFVSPMLVGGTAYVISKNGGHGSFTKSDNYRATATKLNALDAPTVVQAAKLVVEHLATIKQYWDAAPSPGSGCDSGVWTQLDYDADYGEELWDLFYFQAEPEVHGDLVYYSLMNWTDTLYAVCKWIHSQITKNQVSLESQASLSNYFDKDKTNPASSDQRAALFGTVDSNWRDVLVERLKCAHFNPVVKEWNEEAQAQEELVKKTASALVFVFTPKQTGFYAFVEVTALAIKDPKRLFVCFLDEDEGQQWDAKQQGSINAIKGYLTNECGMTVYTSLDTLADAVNGEVTPVSENDTADAQQPQEQLNDNV